MTASDRPVLEAVGEVQLCVLRRLKHGWVTATCWLEDALKQDGHPTTPQRLRRQLRKMATAGFVEPEPYSRSGRIYHWRITEAGRALLSPTPIVNAGEDR